MPISSGGDTAAVNHTGSMHSAVAEDTIPGRGWLRTCENMAMAQRTPTTTAALDVSQRQQLARAFQENDDVTIFVNGTSLKLPAQGTAAVVDLIRRLADGDAVMVSSVTELLTTSQAAETAGISHTYLRNLTDAGVIPVEYRGTHRRIRLTDILDWLEEQKNAQHGTTENAK